MPNPIYYNFLNAINNPTPAPFRSLSFNQPSVQPPSPASRLSSIALPDNAKLIQLLQNAPTRETVRPTKLGTLSALLSGVSNSLRSPGSGFEAYQQRMDRPFLEAQQDYQGKVSQAQAMAQLDQQRWANEVAQATAEYNQADVERKFRQSQDIFEYGKGRDITLDEFRRTDQKLSGMREVTDPVSGQRRYVSLLDPQGQAINVGQVALTPEQQINYDVDKAKKTGQVGLNYSEQLSRYQSGLRMDEATKQNALDMARDRAKFDARLEEVKTRTATKLANAGLKPTDAMFAVLGPEINIMDANNPGIEDYYKVVVKNGIPEIILTNPNATDQIGNKYNGLIKELIAKMANYKGRQETPPGNITSSGGRYQITPILERPEQVPSDLKRRLGRVVF